MENKTIFDAWLETNSKFMNNWVSSTQKLQEAVRGGQGLEKGTEIYQEWLNNQTEIAKTAAEKNQAAVGSIFSAPLNGNGNNAATDIYNNWIETQQKAMKGFLDASQFYAPLAGNNDAFSAVRKAQEQWVSNYSTWMNQWTAPFNALTNNLGDSTARDAYQNMLNTSNTYFKMYEVWAPLYRSMQNNTFSPELFKQTFSTEKFKELMDKSLEFLSPVQVKELYAQFASWFETINNYNRHIFQQFAGNMPQAQQLMPFLLFGNNPQNPANNMFGFYQRAFNPLVRLFNPGKESELNEQFSALLDKFAQYGQKLNELQYLMYTTGAKNFEKFVFDNYEEVKKGADLGNYQQVFQAWVAKNEEAFVALFRTDEYSKLQGELLDLGLELKNGFEKIAETSLASLPIMLRSEADELYQTIYELKKRVRQLEKAAGIEEGAVEAAVETEKKETKASKKKTANA
jgi:hypothetical protein